MSSTGSASSLLYHRHDEAVWNKEDRTSKEEEALTEALLSEDCAAEMTERRRADAKEDDVEGGAVGSSGVAAMERGNEGEDVDVDDPDALILSQLQPSNGNKRQLCLFSWCCWCCCCFRWGSESESGACCLMERSRRSLCNAVTTPCWARWFLPLAVISTHALFLYGQIVPMWKLNYSAHVDGWFNATSTEARAVFYTLGIPENYHFVYTQQEDVRTFTYKFAIEELWHAKGMPGKLLPRISAALLVLFSGVWPHLKLLLLLLTWWFSVQTTRRTRILHWLSCLGKWSLADVLVVCVMVGVLNLDWAIQFGLIKQGIISEWPLLMQLLRQLYTAPGLCANLLHLPCGTSRGSIFDKAKCLACSEWLAATWDHPETSKKTIRGLSRGIAVTDGQAGTALLRVKGMRGIYAFCGAVVASIALSLLVDIFDVRAKRHALRERQQASQQDNPQDDENPHELSLQVLGTYTHHDNLNDTHQQQQQQQQQQQESQLLLAPQEPQTTRVNQHSLSIAMAGTGGDNEDDQVTPPLIQHDAAHSTQYYSPEMQPQTQRQIPNKILRLWVMPGFSIATWGIVWSAVLVTMWARKVSGAIPTLLQRVLGIDWDRNFSFTDLFLTTGAAGGWDFLLMATFGLFLVWGPAVRVILCAVAIFCGPFQNRKKWTRFLTSIDFLGAFCAWEVIVLATYMVAMLMPAITSTILMKPQCSLVVPNGSCLEVSFDPTDNFFWIIVGGFMLVGLAYAIPRCLASDTQRRTIAPPASGYVPPHLEEENKSNSVPLLLQPRSELQ